MITVKCFHRLSKSAAHACLLCVLTFWGTSPRASAALQRRQTYALTTQEFFCRAGYDPQECEQRIAQLKAVLIQYPADAPKNWRWVIVPSEDWQPLVKELRLDRESPAFSAITERETFLEDALFFAHPGRTNQLVRHFGIPFDQLLSVAVGHELGHAICHGGSEAIANRAAEQLRTGKHPDCAGNIKSLTPIEELYLHSQSPRFRHF
jgi:hypothetical protein